MRTYSLDLRERALAAVDRGMSRKEAVGVFGVSISRAEAESFVYLTGLSIRFVVQRS